MPRRANAVLNFASALVDRFGYEELLDRRENPSDDLVTTEMNFWGLTLAQRTAAYQLAYDHRVAAGLADDGDLLHGLVTRTDDDKWPNVGDYVTDGQYVWMVVTLGKEHPKHKGSRWVTLTEALDEDKMVPVADVIIEPED